MVITAISSGSIGNAYRVNTSKHDLLLEAGIPYKKIIQAFDFQMPDVVLCTHCHGDHAKSLKDFAKKGIPVVCSDGTAKAMGIEEWQRDDPRDYNTIVLGAIHDAPDPSMFVVDDPEKGERLFFATDTESIPHKIDGITHMMIEVNWSKFTMDESCEHGERSKKTHLSLEEAIEWIEEQDTSKLQEVHLIHLSNGNSHATFFEDEMAKVVGVPVYVH